MKKLSKTEAEFKKSVAYKKSVQYKKYFPTWLVFETTTIPHKISETFYVLA